MGANVLVMWKNSDWINQRKLESFVSKTIKTKQIRYSLWTAISSNSTQHKHISRLVIAEEVFELLHHTSCWTTAVSSALGHSFLTGNSGCQPHQPILEFPWGVFNFIVDRAAARTNTVALIEEEKEARERQSSHSKRISYHNSSFWPSWLVERPYIVTMATLWWAGSSILYQGALSVSSSRLIPVEMFQ